jgi:hypothetical protein
MMSAPNRNARVYPASYWESHSLEETVLRECYVEVLRPICVSAERITEGKYTDYFYGIKFQDMRNPAKPFVHRGEQHKKIIAMSKVAVELQAKGSPYEKARKDCSSVSVVSVQNAPSAKSRRATKVQENSKLSNMKPSGTPVMGNAKKPTAGCMGDNLVECFEKSKWTGKDKGFLSVDTPSEAIPLETSGLRHGTESIGVDTSEDIKSKIVNQNKRPISNHALPAAGPSGTSYLGNGTRTTPIQSGRESVHEDTGANVGLAYTTDRGRSTSPMIMRARNSEARRKGT